MDEPVRSRLRAARHRGLTRPDPVTATTQAHRPPASTSPAKDPDKPQNTPAAGKPRPENNQDHLSAGWHIQDERQNLRGGSRLRHGIPMKVALYLIEQLEWHSLNQVWGW